MIVAEIQIAQTEERGKASGRDSGQMIMTEVDGVQLVKLGERLLRYHFQVIVANVEDGQSRHIRHWHVRHIGQKVKLQPELVGVGGAIESTSRDRTDLIM